MPIRAVRWLLFSLLVASLHAAEPTRRHPFDLQAAVDRGGIVRVPPGIYVFHKTIVVRKSGTVIEGAGPDTVFRFQPTDLPSHCVNDRAFTTPCTVVETPIRRIPHPIAIGDTSFTAEGDLSDLRPGDWLYVAERDPEISAAIYVDWVRVKRVLLNRIEVDAPFRVAFSTLRPWDPDKSGLGFRRIPLVENVVFRNFTLEVEFPAKGQGISVFAAKNTRIDHVTVDNANGQPLYSYLSKELTITHCAANGTHVISEFADTVDLTIRENIFHSTEGIAVGLDLGTAFFRVSDNTFDGKNIGFYMLDGVHDGTMQNNAIGFVESAGGAHVAAGIVIRGSQRVTVTNNYLEGGAGPNSIGISIAAQPALVPIPSLDNIVKPNVFGPDWAHDYDPRNK